MSKAMRVLLPILIIVALLATGYWYFFRYRPDLTAGFFADLAESRLESGNYKAAVRYYEWAHGLTEEDTDLSLKLAEAYRRSGNYTKTERTLVRAIKAEPDNAQLYIRLSSVYVEQGKLYDAQKMLDGIANEVVLEVLSQRRPAAPVFSPEEETFDDYISVELSFEEDAVCCYTTDGSYPTLQNGTYEGPIPLGAGKTRIRAVAVDAEGLVSRESEKSYLVAGVVEEVSFSDAALEQHVRSLLNVTSRPLRTDDLWGILELKLPEEIADTADLQYFTGLEKLTVWDKDGLDYSFLAYMPDLRYLELDHCNLAEAELTCIAACPNLEVLILSSCNLSTVAPLQALTGLRILDLTDNSISSMEPLAGMTSLDELYLGHNALSRLPDMRKLRTIRTLDLSYNVLETIAPLSVCSTLERVNVSHNKLVSIKPAASLPNLIYFNASSNSVRDVSTLANCTKLETFVMTDNLLTSIDFLGNITSVREINIDYNDVVAVPDFPNDCALETFSAAHNFLEDLSGLGGLEHLTVVNADYNNIRDISVLKDCPVLARVNVYGTYVHSDGGLAENGVVVNFTPSVG